MQIYRSKSSTNGYLFKVSQAAILLAVSQDTLRRWEKSGKLIPLRTPGGTRLYSLSDLRKINPDLKLTSFRFNPFKLPTRVATLTILILLFALSFFATISVRSLTHSSDYKPSSTLILKNALVTQNQPDHEVLAAALTNQDQLLGNEPVSNLHDSSIATKNNLGTNASTTWAISPEDCIRNYTNIHY